MSPKQTFTVSKQRDEGFMLNIEEHSRFRDGLYSVLDTLLCAPFGHRFYWQFWLCNALGNWADKKVVRVARIPITYEDADKIFPGAFDWTKD